MKHYTDLMTNGTEENYHLEEIAVETNPESMLIAAEAAQLAGEDYEGCGVVGFSFGYRSPCNGVELVEAMCRRGAIHREEQILSELPDRAEELRWKRKVRRRTSIVKEELPRKLRFYGDVKNCKKLTQ